MRWSGDFGEGVPIVISDAQTSPPSERWREHVKRFGYASVMAVPLKTDGRILGVLVICAAEAAAFAQDEALLLGEAASDLASAIIAQRAQAERERLTATLRSIEERFAAAAEASPDALFVFESVRDASGTIVDFKITALNGRAVQQIGIAQGDAIGKTYLGLLPLYKTVSRFDEYATVASTGKPFEGEFTYEVPGKGTRWFRHQVVRVHDGIAISLRDVTAWKMAGEKLRHSEERLRLAMEAGRMGALEWNLESGAYISSELASRLFGMSPSQVARSMGEMLTAVHPADRVALGRAIAEGHKTDTPSHVEFRVVWPDGSVHWLDVHRNSILDATGKAVRAMGIVMDITERKQAELEIKRANRALTTLSAGNEELVHATSESGLLHAVCRVLVEKGGYRMASVDYPKDDPQKSIIPMAQAQAPGYINDNVTRTWADTAEGQLPVAQAIRSKRRALERYIPGGHSYAAAKAMALSESCIANLALPLLDDKRLVGVLSIRADDLDAFDEAEIRLLEELADDLAFGIVSLRTRAERDAIAYDHKHHAEILRRSLEDSIQAIAATVEMRDPYTSGHQKRVANIAAAIAAAMGLDEETIHGIHLAGVVHDLGKISVPAEILSKPGRLSALEHELIKDHPQTGYNILKDIKFPWPIAEIVRQHHERVDGSGYPRGMKGGEMLLESRIMAVADVVEAMASHRPYRASLGIEPALKEIERGRGTAYDPTVADACLKLFRESGFAIPT